MTAHNDVKSSGSRVKVKLVYFVQNVNRKPPSLDHCVFGQRGGPSLRIDIPSDRDDRSDRLQPLQYLRISYITRVNDQVATLQRVDGFLAYQTMSIRDQSDLLNKFCHFRMLPARHGRGQPSGIRMRTPCCRRKNMHLYYL